MKLLIQTKTPALAGVYEISERDGALVLERFDLPACSPAADSVPILNLRHDPPYLAQHAGSTDVTAMAGRVGTYLLKREPGDEAHAYFLPREGALQRLPMRHDLRNHSPDGFEWGYGGSGPAQLALAICAHATGDERQALRLYQSFKFRVIAKLDREGPHELTTDHVLEELLRCAGAV